jgi:hypothetical protein
MALWWMSNLRDTPLQLTEDTSTSGRQFVFPPETKTVWIDVGVNKETDFYAGVEQGRFALCPGL